MAQANAEEIAADAVGDAWIEILGDGMSIEALGVRAEAKARDYAFKEIFGSRRHFRIADAFEENQGTPAIIVAVEAEQESRHGTTLRFEQVREVMTKLNETDSEILRLMLVGLGSLEIAKAIRRAVPLVVQDLHRIRKLLVSE